MQITKTEGISAVSDAINFVKKSPDLKPLYWNKYLSKVCKVHAQYCAKHNNTSHKNKKGEKASERMKKYGHVFFGGAENIINGSNNPIESVLNLIIDDGVSDRGHRKNILAEAHRTIGVASEPHPSLGVVVVCNYAFHYCSTKLAEPLTKIIQEWTQED